MKWMSWNPESPLRLGLCVSLALVLLSISTPLGAGQPPLSPEPTFGNTSLSGGAGKIFRLRLRHAHTDESLDVVYRQGSEYLRDGIAQLNHFLRDYRTDEDADYDVREFDLLSALMRTLHRPDGVIEVLCGYRSPDTNAYLRSRAPLTGVAENSLHIRSMAIDLRVPGVTTERLRLAALSLHMGGVGYYPRSHFVHVDVGPVRQWTFGGSAVRKAAVQGGRSSHVSPSF